MQIEQAQEARAWLAGHPGCAALGEAHIADMAEHAEVVRLGPGDRLGAAGWVALCAGALRDRGRALARGALAQVSMDSFALEPSVLVRLPAEAMAHLALPARPDAPAPPRAAIGDALVLQILCVGLLAAPLLCMRPWIDRALVWGSARLNREVLCAMGASLVAFVWTQALRARVLRPLCARGSQAVLERAFAGAARPGAGPGGLLRGLAAARQLSEQGGLFVQDIVLVPMFAAMLALTEGRLLGVACVALLAWGLWPRARRPAGQVVQAGLWVAQMAVGSRAVAAGHVNAGQLVCALGLSQAWIGSSMRLVAHAHGLRPALRRRRPRAPRGGMPAAMGTLQARRLTVQVGARVLLQPCDIVLPGGGALGIVGDSGAGKTVLVAALRRQAPGESRGDITLGGSDGVLLGRALARVVPVLLPGTVGDNITLLRDIPAAQVAIAARQAGVVAALDAPGLSLDLEGRVCVAMARALCGAPAVVLLDDALEALTVARAQALVARFRALPVSLVVLTRRPAVVADLPVVQKLERGDLSLLHSLGGS